MPDAQASPVFSIGTDERSSGSSRLSRSASGRRNKPAVSRVHASDASTTEVEAALRDLAVDVPAPATAAAPLLAAATGCTFTIGVGDTTAAPRRPTQRGAKANVTRPASSDGGVTEASASTSDVPPPPRSAWTFGAHGADAEGETHAPADAPGKLPPQQVEAQRPTTARGSSSELGSGEHPSWRLAEDQKERGNRRYAIKSWAEAHTCYRKALDELKRHPQYGTISPEGRALASKSASYHANSAAALMQLGKLSDALTECDAALTADRKLGKALLRVAHVQLMLGDTDEARRYYVEAASVGAEAESEAGMKACAADEQQASRLHAELIMCRRAAASAVGNAPSTHQLKTLVSTLEAACSRAPHNASLRSLQAESLSASGRMAEAHALCEMQIAGAAAHRGHTAIWLYTLGRVLYDSSLLPEAAEKLSECLQRQHAPQGAKPLARLVQRLENERSAGNEAFKRNEWSGAVAAYTRALAVDPTHARFNALLYCNRGAAHAKNGAVQQALADCSAAIALNRSYAKAYLRRAELRLRCGDRARALEDFGAAQRLDGNGAVGQESARRVSEMRKESAREAAAASAAAAAAGAAGGSARGAWDRARAHQRAGGFHSGSHGSSGSGGSNSSGSHGQGISSTSSSKPDHYQALGVEPSVDADAIRKAYKKLCLKFHPDKAAGNSTAEREAAQKKFLEVQKAYEVLSDASQRRIFDAERSRGRSGFGGFGARNYGFGSFGEDDLFSAFGRGGRPGSRR